MRIAGKTWPALTLEILTFGDVLVFLLSHSIFLRTIPLTHYCKLHAETANNVRSLPFDCSRLHGLSKLLPLFARQFSDEEPLVSNKYAVCYAGFGATSDLVSFANVSSAHDELFTGSNSCVDTCNYADFAFACAAFTFNIHLGAYPSKLYAMIG